MTAGAKPPTPVANGTHTLSKPLELALTVPSNPSTRIHLHLTIHPSTLTLFLTSTSLDNAGGAGAAGGGALGSFVYALPDRYNPAQPLSTPLYSSPTSLDFVTRLARVLARKTGRACYVGGGVSLRDAVRGGDVEEEMEVFTGVVGTVVRAVERVGAGAGAGAGGG